MHRLAILIPCFNEAVTIAKVVRDFHAGLPRARVFVYDNGSTDETVALAREAGAEVRHEPLRGKGNVVRRMFADVEADVYVLVDGDDTYDASAAPRMVDRLIEDSLDMVNGARISGEGRPYRPGHALGNRILTGTVAFLFGNRISDLLSGYRVFSRRFVKTFPALSTGFEIETELSIHALQLALPLAEVPTAYRERPPGSSSKLRTVSDGFWIARIIMRLLRNERPLGFFGIFSIILAALSLGFGVPVVMEFFRTHLVPRQPTAILAASLAILSVISFVCGLILDTVSRGRVELKRLRYLSEPGLHRD
jgi:glycosyltransferase involved in cell wall biosynthesis